MSKSLFDGVRHWSVVSGTWRVVQFAIVTMMAAVFGMTGFVSSAEAAISFVSASSVDTAANNSTNIVIPNPGSIQVDDILIAAIGTNSNPTVTPPTGWNVIRNAVWNTNDRAYIAWRRATAADATGNYTFNFSAGTSGCGGISVYRGVESTASPIDAENWNTNAASLTITATPLSTNTTDTEVLFVGFLGNDRSIGQYTSATSPASYTERFDVFDNRGAGNVTVAMASGAKPATGSTGATTATVEDGGQGPFAAGNTINAAAMIALVDGCTPSTVTANSTQTPSGTPVDLCSTFSLNTDGTNAATLDTYTVYEVDAESDYFDDNSVDAKWTKSDFATSGDIADVGTVNETGGEFVVEGGGADIWDNAGNNNDGFTYVHQGPLSGDFSIDVKVISQENTNVWAKAGVMIRDSLTNGSKHAMMVTTPSNGSRFQYRVNDDGASTNNSTNDGGSSTTDGSVPVWLRLTRTGDAFAGYWSLNGTTWNLSDSVASLPMTGDVYIGLAVTSHVDNTLSTVVFDDFVVNYNELYSDTTCSNIDASTWTTGTKYFDVIANDGCGGTDTDSGTFVYTSDSTAPTVGNVSVTAGGTGSFVAGTFSMSASVTEGDSTVSSCAFSINGGSTYPITGTVGGSSPNWTCTVTNYNYSGSDGDSLNLRAQATSGGGTGSSGANTSVTVDTAAPSTSSSPGAGSYTSNQSATLSSNDGSGSGVSGIQYCLSTGADCTPGTTYSGAIAVDGTPGISENRHLCYEATDNLGNTETTVCEVYTIDLTCTPGVITIPNGQTVSGASVDLSALHSNTGNISGFTYKINTVAETSPWDSTSFGAGVPEDVTLEVSGTDTDCSVTVTQSNTISVDNRPNDLTVGVASGSQSGLTTITVTMPYAGDKNGDATFQVDYKLASVGTWTDGTAQDDADNLTPYLEPLVGLAPDETYDIRVTYFDDDGVTGTNPQTFQVTLVSWVDDYLLHNSNRFACSETGFFSNEADCTAAGGTWTYDRKWTVAGNEGEWGTDGANDQYGPIMCSTCHQRNGGNIKRITKQVVASTNTFPGQSETISALVADPTANTSDYGDDNDGRGASGSNRICEVCHSLTDYHRYDLTGQPGGLLHYNNKDCISCHEHEGGFRASCSACHGNPPPPLVSTKSTNSGTAGAHDAHVNTLGYDCARCHSGSVGGGVTHDTDGTVTITFADLPLGDPAGADGGSYSGQTGVTYDATDGGTTTVPGANDGQMTCANYCHGSTIGGTGEDWNDPSTPCGSCHGGTAGSPPASPASEISHLTHAGTGGTGIYQGGDIVLNCTQCHDGPFNDGSHVTGAADYDVSPLASDYRASGTPNRYAGNETGDSGGLAPSATYSTCTNLACHWGTETPEWDNGPATCDTCHPASPTSGKHADHINASDDYVTCDNCHGSGATTGTHSGHIDFSLTLNPVNNADTLTDAKFSGAGTRGDTRDDTCVTICHKDGDWGDGSVASTASAPANQGTIDWTLDCGSTPVQDACIDCHSDAYNGEAGPQVITNWSGTPTGTHLKIVNSDSLPGNACADVTNWKNRCNGCHDKHSGTVQIPVPTAPADQTALGMKYDGVDHGGYIKLKPNSGSTTEAQTCWNCHTAAENEWASSPYSTTGENWTTMSFNSPASGIPARSVRSVHTGNVNVAGISSVDEYLNQADRGNLEAVADIRCSYCHDLHSLGANGYTPTGAPYLRGTWMTNPYALDRPPMNGDTYPSNNYGTPGPDSPRLYATSTDSKNTAKPGYFIDQNSDWPTVKTPASGTFYTYTETGGLCQLCHQNTTDTLDEYAGTSLWNGAKNGHANSTLSGSGPANGNEIFDGTRGYGNVNGGGTWMGAQHGAYALTSTSEMNYGVTSTYGAPKGRAPHGDWSPSEPGGDCTSCIPPDNIGWYGGTAGDRSNLGDQYSTWYNGGGIGTAGTYSIAGVYIGTSPRAHNFSCSKCHDPHASGLPALLVTNCLDTYQSTWNNNSTSKGPKATTGSGNGWGYAAAVTCHRKRANTGEDGWNTLTAGD